ncbi:hypothetical protein [Mycobacteroides franklinii]|uniref:hypothetical protein n=1 Tax=Mycobacteroides franklinii TaxID=948102 RepID=UPI0030136F67
MAATAITRQLRSTVAARTVSTSARPTGPISTTPAPCTGNTATASPAIEGGTVAPNRPCHCGGIGA